MTERPWLVTASGFLFVLVGIAEFAAHIGDFTLKQPVPHDILWPLGLGVVAIICGVSLLRRKNWARWLAVAWLAFHVVVGGLNSRQQLIMHSVLLVVFAYALFCRESGAYFRANQRQST
jgi:hypothetical protein